MKISENSTTEYKRQYVDDLKKTVSAFANTNGGSIFIGINDDGSPCGLVDPASEQVRISNHIRDNIRPDLTMFVDYETIVIDGCKVLKITVQKATSPPYYLVSKGIIVGGVYIRQGASSVPASETAILRMIKEADGDIFEEMRHPGTDFTFIEASDEFKKRGIAFDENNMQTLKLRTADGIFTNLAFLLSDQCAYTIKIAVFEGKDKSVFLNRREFGGSLFRQLNDAYEFIELNNRIKAKIKGLYRSDTRDYPLEAVREALLNMIVHRDYSLSGSSFINIFEDRIEFITLGGLVKGIEYGDLTLGISMSRNPGLVNVFYRLKLIEAYGTGIPNIMNCYADVPSKPVIDITPNAFRLTLPNVNHVFDSLKEQPADYLTKHEIAVMELFDKRKSISRQDAEVVLTLSQPMTVRVLRGMVEKRLISVVGAGKNTRYISAKTAPRA